MQCVVIASDYKSSGQQQRGAQQWLAIVISLEPKGSGFLFNIVVD